MLFRISCLIRSHKKQILGTSECYRILFLEDILGRIISFWWYIFKSTELFFISSDNRSSWVKLVYFQGCHDHFSYFSLSGTFFFPVCWNLVWIWMPPAAKSRSVSRWERLSITASSILNTAEIFKHRGDFVLRVPSGLLTWASYSHCCWGKSLNKENPICPVVKPRSF